MAYSNRRIVLGFSSVIVVAFGSILYGFSVYVTDGAAGADFSTTVLSLGLTGSGIAGALLARPLGKFMDSHGARGVTVVGATVACVGMVAFSMAQAPWHVFAAWWLLIGPATAAVYYEPSMVGIAGWIPPSHHPKAFGALTLIGGLAGAIFIPLSERLVSAFGWRPTVQILGVAILVAGWIAGWFAIPSGRGQFAARPLDTRQGSGPADRPSVRVLHAGADAGVPVGPGLVRSSGRPFLRGRVSGRVGGGLGGNRLHHFHARSLFGSHSCQSVSPNGAHGWGLWVDGTVDSGGGTWQL